MKNFRLNLITALLMFTLLVGVTAGAPVPPIVSQPIITNLPALQKIVSTALSNLVTMAEVEGQILGAGKGQLVTLDEAGKITRTMTIPINIPAGISAYTPGKALVGDGGNNLVYAVDIKSGQTQMLLDLKNTSYTPLDASGAGKALVKTPSGGGILAGDILKSGTLMSVAYDGRYVYVGVSAGYSSSIFTIEPGSNRAVAQVWAPGDKPIAMQFSAGNLYVLDGSSNKIRLFDAQMELNLNAIEVQTLDPKGLIIRDNEIKVLSPTERSIVVMRQDLLLLQAIRPQLIWKIRDILVGPILPIARDYALLICGDIAESGYDEFWNDTIWMFKTLLAAGYTEDHIYVLYGWGNDYASANPNYQHSSTVTDFPATVVWVDKVINGLKNGDASIGVTKLNANDSLFVWVFDHGGGGSPAYFCLRDGVYYDTTFGTNTNSLLYRERAVFMQQCRSGGFIDNMQGEKTFISTACRSTENAHRADTENESYGGTVYHHGEYNYYIISAIAGRTPTGAVINADSNGDGKISAREAHNYNTSHENQSEIPQMNDNYGVGSSFIVR